MLTENNRLDHAMSASKALTQHHTDLERIFASMTALSGIPLTGASAQELQAIEDHWKTAEDFVDRFFPTPQRLEDRRGFL